MKIKEWYTYKFIIVVGIFFWLFIIPSILSSLNLETTTPEPTLTYAILFTTCLLLAVLWFVGNLIIIPLSYLISLILLILDIYRVCFNKILDINTDDNHIVYKIFAILGFILGGVTSVFCQLDFYH